MRTSEELHSFLENVCYFHDCCVVEMHYVSGAHCTGHWMSPVNDRRELNVTLHGAQNGVLTFFGLKFCKLVPEILGTCEILGVSMWADEKGVFWCDDDNIGPENLEKYTGTVICAESVTWAALESAE